MRTAITHFIDRHPVAIGSLGTVSGLSSALLKWLHVAAGVAADIGMLCGGATAAVTLCIAVRNWKRDRWEREALEKQIAIREMWDEDNLT